ncbi:hypothetical protein, conserved [Eimeria praecox]|uniref:Uncharacterized protein n=1 Tax=Eimeria praecox TaxID=51316 RepID=U6H0L1_9EIME|nr:hypothetical protein, conserved [Eimeria praecox]
MASLSSSRGRLAWGPLAVLGLWAITRGVISTGKATRRASHFATNTAEVRKHGGLVELPVVPLGQSGSAELFDSQRDISAAVESVDDLAITNHGTYSGLQLASSPNTPPGSRYIDPVLQNGLANLLVTTLGSLFLDNWKHNMYARLVSDLRLPDTVDQSLAGFMRNEKQVADSYTHSTVLENLKTSMVMAVREYLDPQNVGDIIDQALVPSEPSATQLINFSTETISIDKFKTKHPFVFVPHHVETPVHVFTSELRRPGTTYYKLLRSLQSIALPILVGQSTSHWDPLVSHQIRPLMVEADVKVQDLMISLLKDWAHKLPNLLEWVNRDVDYRALVATDWGPLIGALSNWEAKDEMYSSHGLNWRDAARMKQMYLFFLQQAARMSFLEGEIEEPLLRPGTYSCMSQFVARLQSTGSPRLKAMLDRVNLPSSFLTWELVNQCFLKRRGSDCGKLPLYFTSVQGKKLILSVSDEAVPLEFELREPPNRQTVKLLSSFPRTVRPMRSPFGYAGKERPVSSQPAGLFAGIGRSIMTRTKKSHGPKISMRIEASREEPEFLTIILEAKGKVVQLVGRPLHMLQRIDPFQCEAGKEMKPYLNYFQEDENAVRREGNPWEGLPANRVVVSYASDKLTPRTRTTLSHILQLLFPKNVVDTILDRFSNRESFKIATAGGMQATINFLRDWYLTKKLLRSAYPEARDLEIQQDISEWHNTSRRDLDKMLRQNGVDGKPFKESWTVILNCNESAENVRWEVLDLNVADQERMVVKQYAQEFGELAALASAVEKELSMVAGVDHVLKRMQESFFEYAYKRTLYIESPGAFLQQLIDSNSQQIAREFERWLLQRLQGNSRNKRCRRASFYGKAYAQYKALVAYYEKKDLTAPVPDLEEVKRFLLTASVPKGHLVRIPPEEDSQHSGIYRMVERVDRCTFLLEDANRFQLATDASLHIVRSFEDGDQISHQYIQRRQYKFTAKDLNTGVCKVRDRHGFQFEIHPEETTPITIGQFADQGSKLTEGTWVLYDSKAAYNTLLELKTNYLTEFEVEKSIVQDCYTGLACIIRDDRDLPIMVHYAIPELATYAWTGPWLWLFLNGLHAEYLSIISRQQFVKSLEDRFWTQRTINELAHSCWELPDEASLTLDRKFLTPSTPSRISRAFALFKRSHEETTSIPNRCSASFENFNEFFPGASSGAEVALTSPGQLFSKQTEQIVSMTAYAAYVLRKEREESAISGVKQHFRARTCGSQCAAWWLKASELKAMAKRFSEAGQEPMTPQHEQFILTKTLSSTPLGEYWTNRICTFQKSFRNLFSRMRLPYEQENTTPCSKVSAIMILATIMSDITLLVRRRAVTSGRMRMKNMERLLNFLKDNDVPVPCTYDLPEAADLLKPNVPADSEECRQRDAASNAFMHMKSLIDASHVQVDDVIQEIRKRFSATLHARLSPGFISATSEEYRRQAVEFREVDEEVDDLFAALYRPFAVWQGTFKHRQQEEFLDLRMQQQCPFRPPQPTRHAKEVVPGAHIQLIQGYLPFGYNGKSRFGHSLQALLFVTAAFTGTSFANSVVKFVLEEGKAEESLKETTWPLLGFLLRQTVVLQSDPQATYELQCDTLKSLRLGLRKLGLGTGEKTVQQAVQQFLEDVNFAEVASFLPPPVEGFDAYAVPMGFLRLQSGQTPYSVLVTPSGDALFGKCRPGSLASVALLRDVWRKAMPDLDQASPSKWRYTVTRHVDAALNQMGSTAECQSQRNYFIRELTKAFSHNTPVQVGDKAWRGSVLVVVEKIEPGIKFVRPAVTADQPEPPEATTEPLFAANKLTIGDAVLTFEGYLTYDLLDIALIGSVGCVSRLRRKDSGQTVLSRKPLFRLNGFQRGELVRKSSSIEVYEYMGTCGNTYALKDFVTGEMEWATEDLLPLWAPLYDEVLGTTPGQLGRAYPQKELHMGLILVLREFHRTEGSQISRIQFKKVLALLESYDRLSPSDKESLQTTFDRRVNKETFYETVESVQKLAADLQAELETKINSGASTDIQKEMLFAWGNATIAALEAMWRGRSLWRMLHRIHQHGLTGFFAEINNLAQRPDLSAAINSIKIDTLRELGQKAINDYVPASGASLSLPSIADAMDRRAFQSSVSRETRPTLDQFLSFIADSVIPRRALTTLLSSSSKVDGYRKTLQSRDSILPQSGLNATWTDKIMLKLTEVIGSLMKQELGNKIPAEQIKSTLQPVILQELVDVSDLSFSSESGKERVFGKLSEFLADQISRLYQIQRPGRVPRGEVLLDVLSLLEVEGSEVRELAEEGELLKAAASPKSPGSVKPMRDMGSLKRIYTRFLAIGAGAVSTAGFHLLSKITGTLIPDHLANVSLFFWTQITTGALHTGLRSAFIRYIGLDAAPNIKLVQNSVWLSGVQPWLDSLTMQTAVLEQLLSTIEAGQPLDRDWWQRLPLLVFIKRNLDTVRSSVFDPSNLYRTWSQIKFVTSAPSGLYKVLMAPVKGLGSYLYLLLIELLNGILPAENGDFLVPLQLLGEEKERPAMDIAVANPYDLIKYLHRLFDVLLKVYVPMFRELFDTGIQLVLQKLGHHISKDNGTLEVWRLINHIADHDVDGEVEEIFRELLFRIADDVLKLWPAMPLGSPQPWQQM